MSRLDVDDTIAAVASPPGPGARGIIRISGPQTANCLARCVQANTPVQAWRPGIVQTGILSLEQNADLECELLFWPDQRSYTRQPSAEIHTIGNPILLSMALEQICQHGARMAEPGEFTLRAFLSGRLDLTQAEAVLAVIDARQEKELGRALEQLAGGLSGPLACPAHWR